MKYDKLELLIALAGLIFGYLQWRWAIKGFKFSKRIAKAEGIFDKPEVSIGLGIADCMYTGNIVLIKYVIPELPNKARLIVPFAYGVINTGKKSLEDTEFYVTFPNTIHPNKSMGVSFGLKTNNVNDIQYKEGTDINSENMHVLGYKVGKIAPDGNFVINDSLLLTGPTQLDFNLPVKSKFKKVLRFNVAGNFFYKINFSIRSNHSGLFNRTINVEAITASKYSEASALKDFKAYVEKNKQQFNGTTGFLIIKANSNKLIYDAKKLAYRLEDFECLCFREKIEN